MFWQAKSIGLNNKHTELGKFMSSQTKAKGNSGERKIAEFLSKLYGAKFIRVPNSGAFLGGKNHHRIDEMDQGQIATFKADLIPPSHMRKLVIESKFYADFPFHALLKNEGIGLLDKWIKQAVDTSEPDDFWVVVFRINRRGVFAAFDQKHLDKFTMKNYCRYQTYIVAEFENLFTENAQCIADMVKTS